MGAAPNTFPLAVKTNSSNQGFAVYSNTESTGLSNPRFKIYVGSDAVSRINTLNSPIQFSVFTGAGTYEIMQFHTQGRVSIRNNPPVGGVGLAKLYIEANDAD